MRRILKIVERLSCNLLVGCLLVSLLFVNIPADARVNGQNPMTENLRGVTMRGNPGNPGVMPIAMIVWEMVKLIFWPPGPVDKPFEVPGWVPWSKHVNKVIDWVLESLPRPHESLFATPAEASTLEELEDQFKVQIKKTTEEDLEEIHRRIAKLRDSLEQEIGSRRKADYDQTGKIRELERVVTNLKVMVDEELTRRINEHAKRIAKLEVEVEKVIPEAEDIIKEGKEVIREVKASLQEAQAVIRDMNDKIRYVKSLEGEIEVLKNTNAEQAKTISYLGEGLTELTIINNVQAKTIKTNRRIILLLVGIGVILATTG